MQVIRNSTRRVQILVGMLLAPGVPLLSPWRLGRTIESVRPFGGTRDFVVVSVSGPATTESLWDAKTTQKAGSLRLTAASIPRSDLLGILHFHVRDTVHPAAR
jgi:hypothetical protein